MTMEGIRSWRLGFRWWGWGRDGLWTHFQHHLGRSSQMYHTGSFLGIIISSIAGVKPNAAYLKESSSSLSQHRRS